MMHIQSVNFTLGGAAVITGAIFICAACLVGALRERLSGRGALFYGFEREM